MPASKSGLWLNPRHGTMTGYKNYGCRCEQCRAANARGKARWLSKNRNHVRAYQRDWYGAHPGARRPDCLRKYGLTPERYQELLAAQDGGCAICDIKPTGPLCVDHDHGCCTGQRSCGECIRGLLCNSCNLGIGSLGEDPQRLRRAVVYLDAARRMQQAA